MVVNSVASSLAGPKPKRPYSLRPTICTVPSSFSSIPKAHILPVSDSLRKVQYEVAQMAFISLAPLLFIITCLGFNSSTLPRLPSPEALLRDTRPNWPCSPQPTLLVKWESNEAYEAIGHIQEAFSKY
uniref:Uncharacterized protein n=1 Tax=Glossina austeni TaxID=7395 RepID=A0A1A9V6F0_GLOAU